MKKSLLSILSLCALVSLVSCDPTSPTSTSTPVPSEDKTTDLTTETVPPTSEEVPSTSEDAGGDDIVPSHTEIVMLSDIPGLNAGTNLAEQKTPEDQEILLNHFNTFEPGFLSYFEVKDGTSVMINPDSTKSEGEVHTYMTLGSSKKAGHITFNFSVAIKKITVMARAYSKTYDTYEGDKNNGVTVDSNVKLNLGVKDEIVATKELASEAGKIPEFDFLTYEFATPTTTFNLSNMGAKNRIFLNSLTLDY